MIPETDAVPEPEIDEPLPDCPGGTAVISVDDFYDLLMEQQEQM